MRRVFRSASAAYLDPFESGFDLTLRPERLEQPLKWRRRRMIFVNSMSDLFHKEVPSTFIDRVFDSMEAADWHVFQLLTKRSSLRRRGEHQLGYNGDGDVHERILDVD